MFIWIYHFLSCFLPGIAEANQELIMLEGGISLLSMTAADAEDPQTLRMVAGAIANLCGNGILNLHILLCYVFAHSCHLASEKVCVEKVARILGHDNNWEGHLI